MSITSRYRRFNCSHIRVLDCSRTWRRFSRALAMQETMDDALLRLKTSVFTSFVGSTGPSADGAFSASSRKRHLPAPISGDWSSHNCNSTLTSRAVCSARSRYRPIQ